MLNHESENCLSQRLEEGSPDSERLIGGMNPESGLVWRYPRI
jgi:hypothetical protein